MSDRELWSLALQRRHRLIVVGEESVNVRARVEVDIAELEKGQLGRDD